MRLTKDAQREILQNNNQVIVVNEESIEDTWAVMVQDISENVKKLIALGGPLVNSTLGYVHKVNRFFLDNPEMPVTFNSAQYMIELEDGAFYRVGSVKDCGGDLLQRITDEFLENVTVDGTIDYDELNSVCGSLGLSTDLQAKKYFPAEQLFSEYLCRNPKATIIDCFHDCVYRYITRTNIHLDEATYHDFMTIFEEFKISSDLVAVEKLEGNCLQIHFDIIKEIFSKHDGKYLQFLLNLISSYGIAKTIIANMSNQDYNLCLLVYDYMLRGKSSWENGEYLKIYFTKDRETTVNHVEGFSPAGIEYIGEIVPLKDIKMIKHRTKVIYRNTP